MGLAELVPQFLMARIDSITRIVQGNNQRMWETQGANIGGEWQGNDLVDTGALRDDLTTTTVELSNGEIRWASDLDYADYVDARYTIYGADQQAIDEIAHEFPDYVQEVLSQVIG